MAGSRAEPGLPRPAAPSRGSAGAARIVLGLVAGTAAPSAGSAPSSTTVRPGHPCPARRRTRACGRLYPDHTGHAQVERWMTGTRDDFVSVARSAADLLRAPAVAAAWSEPSALVKFSVGGLAGHLAYRVLAVPQALADPAPQEPIISLLEHYSRVGWVGADLDEEINVRIRHGGAQAAAEGPV